MMLRDSFSKAQPEQPDHSSTVPSAQKAEQTGAAPLTEKSSPAEPIVSLNDCTKSVDDDATNYEDNIFLHKEPGSRVKQYINKKKMRRTDYDSDKKGEQIENIDLDSATNGDGLKFNYYAAQPKCTIHGVSDCNSANCHRKTQTRMNMVLKTSKKSFPPHLYAKVMSKKHGRMDDLSVSSFADLNMYKVGSPMKDVIRRKQPVFYGPPNRRGRRPCATKEGQKGRERCFLPMHITMPAEMVSSFVSSANQCAPEQPSISSSPACLTCPSLDLDKFKKVPHGIGLREQLMGDFSARPVRTRGRPRKDIAIDNADHHEDGGAEECGPDKELSAEVQVTQAEKSVTKRRSENRHVAFQLGDQEMNGDFHNC
ncbi:Hypothetical predicted protein [Cloeon dipterum]|uniref:Uncharacterized protein n=1 Tax=Cloeon dipterum TaxID=197152 RepID=A0A8S1DHR6_9INSE|nr:Hypothetical predicted protein [Cloeon dipterum]